MLKIEQFNLNNRPKQKVIKPKGVYIHRKDLESYRYMIADRYKVRPKDIYITSREMSVKEIKAVNKLHNTH